MTSLASNHHRDPVPSTLEALLDLPGEHFIWGAYRALLGRNPDPAGLGQYLEKLRSGCPKVDILTELRDSPEGSAAANRALTLSRALARTAAPAAVVPLPKLMTHRGQRFVYCAYRTLLVRDPTADEMASCLRELREGRSPIAIVARLLRAPESQLRDDAEMQDLFLKLDRELRRFRWSRFPVIGPLLRRWYDAKDYGSTARRARRTGDVPDGGGGHRLTGARPARMAADLLCSLPVSEDDRTTGQERWRA